MAGLSFLFPALLWALAILPILYFLLRATPPAPVLRRFPAVALLIGLKDEENTPDRTPWWLLLLRLLAIAALILGFAGPILNPDERLSGRGNLVIAMDASWASAQDWSLRVAKLNEIIAQAEQDDRPVALIKFTNTASNELQFQSASVLRDRIAGLRPEAWSPNYQEWQSVLGSSQISEVIWFSDGLAHEGRAEIVNELDASISVISSDKNVLALTPPIFEENKITTKLLALNPTGLPKRVEVSGLDPSGAMRVLALEEVTVSETSQQVSFELPTELRNRVRQIQIAGTRSAGAIVLSDDSLRTRKVALLSSVNQAEGGLLLSPLHYVREALAPSAELIETELQTALLAGPDVLIFADIGRLPESESSAVLEWVDGGGTLVRFAGPRLIASEIGQREEHPLLPVRLRAGGRDLGGAMSWGQPKKLRAFSEDSPFFGLDVPDEVNITSQVLAQPDPNLSDRVLARLEDGTPLVTARDQGAGRVILFHTTANAEWSDLPLSGLFLKMLERLSIGAGARATNADALQGLTWKPVQVLNGFGEISPADNLAGVDGALLVEGVLGPNLQPGMYQNKERNVALNVLRQDAQLSVATWPIRVNQLGLVTTGLRDLKPIVLSFGVIILLLDILASLALSGRLLATKIAIVLVALSFAPLAEAQEDESAIIEAVNNTVLAYVLTGDPRMDETSRAGLRGLSAELFRRTAIEPIEPTGVDIETAELSLYPFLYWPMTEDQQAPTDEAVVKLNQFLRTGGMIMFDTRDASLGAGSQGGTRLGRKLQEIAARLDIPPLEPIPEDHVLTRSFYLLGEFPGRYFGANVWVEASPKEARAEGMPFRNLNDNVTPVLIGGNDWAAAWAIDNQGRYMFPVGRGQEGEYQREIAQRFGVNLIMHVLTGNYKSDQVHVPALLERLGE